MRKFKYWIRDYFGFSQIETNGFIVVLILMLFVFLTPLVYEWLTEPLAITRDDQSRLDSLVLAIAEQDGGNFSRRFRPRYPDDPAGSPALFVFDPNMADEEALLRLGLPRYIAKNIVKYRQKGGRFRERKI
ncbi:MAG: helix-hairpin-helix domain-containing protein [Bacteroidia bacterium]|nr:helix-hairpin-helix domain-containing protein [Bacteroidia bacterium]